MHTLTLFGILISLSNFTNSSRRTTSDALIQDTQRVKHELGLNMHQGSSMSMSIHIYGESGLYDNGRTINSPYVGPYIFLKQKDSADGSFAMNLIKAEFDSDVTDQIKKSATVLGVLRLEGTSIRAWKPNGESSPELKILGQKLVDRLKDNAPDEARPEEVRFIVAEIQNSFELPEDGITVNDLTFGNSLASKKYSFPSNRTGFERKIFPVTVKEGAQYIDWTFPISLVGASRLVTVDSNSSFKIGNLEYRIQNVSALTGDEPELKKFGKDALSKYRTKVSIKGPTGGFIFAEPKKPRFDIESESLIVDEKGDLKVVKASPGDEEKTIQVSPSMEHGKLEFMTNLNRESIRKARFLIGIQSLISFKNISLNPTVKN